MTASARASQITVDMPLRGLLGYAINADLAANAEENGKILTHLRVGEVTSVLYGGNANFYNQPTSRLVGTCPMLADSASEDTWLIPSVGPDYGRLMDATPHYSPWGRLLDQF